MWKGMGGTLWELGRLKRERERERFVFIIESRMESTKRRETLVIFLVANAYNTRMEREMKGRI